MLAATPLRLGAIPLLAILLWAAPAHAAPILSVSPAASTIAAGGEVSVDILVADVTDLFGFQFDLGFDPTVVEFLGATRGDFLPIDVDANDDPIDVFSFFESGGSVSVFDSRACDVPTDPACLGVSGGGRLATLTFSGLQAGLTSLSFSNVVLADASGTELKDVVTRGGSVEVSQLPDSTGTAPTLLLGVGLLAARRLLARRRCP